MWILGAKTPYLAIALCNGVRGLKSLNKHPTDPRQLAPIGLLKLCHEYKALGETLGSNQGLSDKFQHQKYQVEATLNQQLKLLKLTTNA